MILPLFVFFKMICSGLFDVYLASACWEAIVHRFTAAKEYAIIGLCGTLLYTFVQISAPLEFLETLTNDYLASLGLVLLIAYLMRMVIKHRYRFFEKRLNLSVWLFGCVVATSYEMKATSSTLSGLVIAISTSFLFFLCILFLEEMIWAIQTKLEQIKE